MTAPDVPADVMAAIEEFGDAEARTGDHLMSIAERATAEHFVDRKHLALVAAIAKALEAARRDKSWPQWMKDAAAPDPYGNKP